MNKTTEPLIEQLYLRHRAFVWRPSVPDREWCTPVTYAKQRRYWKCIMNPFELYSTKQLVHPGNDDIGAIKTQHGLHSTKQLGYA